MALTGSISMAKGSNTASWAGPPTPGKAPPQTPRTTPSTSQPMGSGWAIKAMPWDKASNMASSSA